MASTGNSSISTVVFSVYDDEETVRNACVQVNSHEMFNANGTPVTNGMYDLRMGTTDYNQLCATCFNSKKTCPGHRGVLALKTHVISSIAIPYVRKWLKIICFKCGSLLVPNLDKYKRQFPKERLSSIAIDIQPEVVCLKCNTIHPTVIKDSEDNFTFKVIMPGSTESKKAAKQAATILWPDAIKDIFSRIPDEIVTFMGCPLASHPAKFIFNMLPVPPNTIRPGVKSFSGGGNVSYHDITNLIQNICKRANALPGTLPETLTVPNQTSNKDQLEKTLQLIGILYYNLTYGSNSTSAVQGNSGKRGLTNGGRQLNSLLRVMQEKKGRIRHSLLGCRTFHIARTTISGNTKLKLNQVALPLAFARTLQVEEVVQEYNYEWLNMFYTNGKKTYPGCTRIIKKSTGAMHDINDKIRGRRLEIGDRLFRDIVDGDLFYFNRQPSLEVASIGVHHIVVIRDPSIHTFQMNVCICEGYNADFDGDQMNGWIARNPACRAEAAIMSRVSNWFISNKSSGPLNGQLQDSVIGSFELTKNGTKLDKFHAMMLFSDVDMEFPRFDAFSPEQLISGRTIVSLMLKHMPINYDRAPKYFDELYIPHIKYDPEDIRTTIINGELVSGVLDKTAVGIGAKGGLFHLISNKYGRIEALKAIFTLQQIVIRYISSAGFTMGFCDLMVSKEVKDQIEKHVASVRAESELITARLLRGEIIPPIGQTVKQFYEQMQLNTLKITDDEIIRWLFTNKALANSGLFKMISTGSRGVIANMIHVNGAVGQTTINDKRMGETLSFGRTQIYFRRFETDPCAYGFVSSNYITGLTLCEFISRAKHGRFDLIAKAILTAQTGELNRVCIMNLQSALTDNFLRVLKDTKIVQLIYGDDGMDPRNIFSVNIRSVSTTKDNMKKVFWADINSICSNADSNKALASKLQTRIDELYQEIVTGKAKFIKERIVIERGDFNRRIGGSVHLPINARQMIEEIMAETKDSKYKPTLAEYEENLEKLNTLIINLPYIHLNDSMLKRRADVPAHLSASVSMIIYHIRCEISPGMLAKITPRQMDKLTMNIYSKCALSRIEPGSAIGIKAAQAVSEPLTQYMLDSHHRSIAGGTSSGGLNRVNEILRVRSIDMEKNSSMLIPIKKEFLGSDAMSTARECANNMECISLAKFTRYSDLISEPYNNLVYPPYTSDKAWVDSFISNDATVVIPADLTNWCFRYVIDKSVLIMKNISLVDIVRKLHIKYPESLIVHTSEAVKDIVIRMWINNALLGKGTMGEINKVKELFEKMLDTPIRGIEGIVSATAKKIIRVTMNDDGDMVPEDVYAVITQGTGLYNVMLNPIFNGLETLSNSIMDTYNMFGIEAARAKIINEVRIMVGDGVNIRHVHIYADEMTRMGRVLKMRGGLNQREPGNTLLQMANSSPINILSNAVLKNAHDKVYGIAAHQLLGATPQIGTLYNTCVVDEDFIRENYKSIDSHLDELN